MLILSLVFALIFPGLTGNVEQGGIKIIPEANCSESHKRNILPRWELKGTHCVGTARGLARKCL